MVRVPGAWLARIDAGGDDARRTFRVLDDARLLSLHDGYGRVGGTQIDTDDGTLDLLI